MKTIDPNEEDSLFKTRNPADQPGLHDFSIESIKVEIKELMLLSGPAIVAQSSFILMNLTDSIFIGGVGTNELAAVALGNSLFFCLVYLGIGLAFGLDTLLSQAYGAGQMRTFGIYLQTSFYVVTLGLVPICAALWYTEDILLLLGQDPKICADAGLYNQWLILGVWPFGMYEILMKFLQCQKIMWPPMITGVIAIILNVPLNMIFIWALGLGVKGAAIGTSLARWLQAGMLVVYVVWTGKYKESSSRLYIEALHPTVVWNYIKIAVPASIMLSIEIIGFNGITLLVGLFQNKYFIDAHASAFNLLVCVFIIPYGWGTAVTVHIGNLLGSGEAKRAFVTAFSSLYAIAVGECILAILIWSLRNQLIQLWSQGDSHLEAIGGEVISFVALAQILDGTNFICGSTIRGIGRQTFGSLQGFFCFYVIQFPVSLALAYWANLKIYGYWYGLAICLACSIIINLAYMIRIDWLEEVEISTVRTEVNTHEDDEIPLDE